MAVSDFHVTVPLPGARARLKTSVATAVVVVVLCTLMVSVPAACVAPVGRTVSLAVAVISLVALTAPATPAVTPITPAVMPMPRTAAAVTRRSLCVRFKVFPLSGAAPHSLAFVASGTPHGVPPCGVTVGHPSVPGISTRATAFP